MVHAPDRSFGSVLTIAFGSMSGFSALTSSSSTSRVSAGGFFFKKILESSVAILQFSFQRCALRVGDTHGYDLPRRDMMINVNFVIGARPAESTFLDKDVLHCADQAGSFRQSYPVHHLKTPLMPLLDQGLRMTFQIS